MSTTLPLFWDISSSHRKDRLDASVKLIGALQRFQKEHSPQEDNAEDRDSLETLNAPDVVYSIRRLIRGLASPRESSRLGFSVALTELLSRLQTIQCADIVSLLLENAKPTGSMTGQEERDVLFAQLFGFTSIIQSGLLVRTAPDEGSSTFIPSSVATFQQVVEGLLALGERKSWLRESAWWTILLAIEVTQGSKVSWKDEALSWLVEKIFKDNRSWPLEKLAVCLRLQELLPSENWESLICPPFKNPKILDSANLAVIARILKESQSAHDESDQIEVSASAWKPQLHFVWDIILTRMLSRSQDLESSFQDFFRIAVDESLFSSLASVQRKYWGFLVFQKALLLIEPSQAPRLLAQNFMRTWINHLSKKDRYLHKISIQIAKDIQAFVKKHPETGLPFVTQLTGERGNPQFDRITNSNTVQSILSSMDEEGIKNYIQVLFSQVNESSQDSWDVRRSWIFDQLSSLIRNSCIPKSDDWIESLLQFFVLNGLFQCKKSPSDLVTLIGEATPESRAACRQHLLKSLGDLNTQTTSAGSGSTSRAAGVASDGQFWTSKVMSTVLGWKSHSKMALVFEDDGDKVLSKAVKTAERLRKKGSVDSDLAKGSALLLDGLILQHFCSPNSEDSDLEALQTCTEALAQSKKSQQPKTTNEEAPQLVDVVLDILIGFMEQSTAFSRSQAKLVFSSIVESLSEHSVDLLLAQLERKSSEELLEDDSDDGGSDASESSSDSDEDHEMEDEINEEDAAELRNKLAAVFNGNQDGNDSASEEDLLDDEQMLAIDEQLTAVFRSRVQHGKSSEVKDVQREATHFKNRILDLVDLFVRKQPSNPLILNFLLPLIELVTLSTNDERQLADKSKGILRNRICKGKDIPSGIASDKTSPLLEKVHELARHCRNSDVLTTLSDVSLYVCRVSSEPSQGVAVYSASLEDFVSRKNSSLNSNFFQQYITRFPRSALEMRNNLLSCSTKAVNAYRACQTVQLLLTLMTQAEYTVAVSLQDVEQAVVQLLNDACDDKASLTNQQVKELLKGCSSLARKIISSKSPATLGWSATIWADLAGKLSQSVRYRDSPTLPASCRRLAEMVEGQESGVSQAAVKRKPKDEDGPSRKRKKVKN